MLDLSESWFKRYHFLYIFGFLVNFKPINPFIYEHYVKTLNLTETEILKEIYPLANYTASSFSLIALLFVGFCFFSYGLIFIPVCGLIVSSLYITLENLLQLQIAQGIFGVILGSELIYFTSIYLCEETKRNDLLKLSSHIRASALIGKASSSLLSHILIFNNLLNYKELSIFGLPACAHAILLFLHTPALEEDQEAPTRFQERFSWIKSNLKKSLINIHVLKLSIWYALAICGNNLLMTYIQPLWSYSNDHIYNNNPQSNALIECVSSLLSFFGVLVAGRTRFNWKYKDSILSVASLVQCILLIVISGSGDMLSNWICYALYCLIFNFVTTCLSVEIVKNLPKGAVGIVFCLINLLAMIVNLIFVVFVVGNSNNFGDDYYLEFFAFGAFHFSVSLIFGGLSILKCIF